MTMPRYHSVGQFDMTESAPSKWELTSSSPYFLTIGAGCEAEDRVEKFNHREERNPHEKA